MEATPRHDEAIGLNESIDLHDAWLHPDRYRKLCLDRAACGNFGMPSPSANAAVVLAVRGVRAAMKGGLTAPADIREELHRRVRAIEKQFDTDSEYHDAWLILSYVFADIVPEKCALPSLWLAHGVSLVAA